MKKAISILAALLFVIALSVVSFATTQKVNYENLEYGFAVGGVAVTNSNKDNIFGDGTASYDPTTNTLSLNGVNLTDTMTIYDEDGDPMVGGLSIYNMNQSIGFHINLTGSNTISGDIQSATCVHVGSSTTGADLTVDGWILCSFDWDYGYENYSPLAFWNDNAVTLTVKNNLYYRWCDERGLFNPRNVPESDTNSVLNVNGVNNIDYNGDPISLKTLISLGNKKVTIENAEDIFNDGTAKFDWNEGNVLYLNNATIDGIQDDRTDYGLEIVLTGNNTINGNVYSATCVNIIAKAPGSKLNVNGDVICTKNWDDIYDNYSPLQFAGVEKSYLDVSGKLYYNNKVFDARNVPANETGSILKVNGENVDYDGEQISEKTNKNKKKKTSNVVTIGGDKEEPKPIENKIEENPDTGAPVCSAVFALPIILGVAFVVYKKF